MIKPKMTAVAALLAASIGSPALAQSFDHTGSQMPYHYDSTGKQVWGSWESQDNSAAPSRSVARNRPVMRSHILYGYAPRHHRR